MTLISHRSRLQLPGTTRFGSCAPRRQRSHNFANSRTAEEFGEHAKAMSRRSSKPAALPPMAQGLARTPSHRARRLEQASEAAKTLAEAKSPTEFFQIQSDLARASFDRMVTQSSKLTERFVKLAGEAVEPLQTRASLNAERINTLVA